MTLLIIKEVTVYSVTKYRRYYYYWIWIILFLLLLFFWRLNPVCIDFTVAASSYTSLGHSIKSNSYASVHKLVKFQELNVHPVRYALTSKQHL